MNPHKEIQASDLASDKKRKFMYTTEVATPDKKVDSKLGDGQLSKGQQPVQSVVPNEATLSAEVQELKRQLIYSKRHKRGAQTYKSRGSGLEKLLQVYAAAEPCSMHDDIAENMRREDWDVFWQVIVTAVIFKRRMDLTIELPQLLDKDWYGNKDNLSDEMMSNHLTMAVLDETDMNELQQLTELKARLQTRTDEVTASLATKQAEVDELRQKVEEAKKKHEAGLKKLHTMGYKLENGKAVPRFDANIISDEQAEDIKLSWEKFKDKVEKCDYQFGHYLMGLFHNLAARDDPNLAARLESYKEYRNARAKDITECKMIESLQKQNGT